MLRNKWYFGCVLSVLLLAGLLVACQEAANVSDSVSDKVARNVGRVDEDISDRAIPLSVFGSKGTYSDFLTAIRTFESSIDPKQAQYYTDNYDNQMAQKYPKVDYPGRVVRDFYSGAPVQETTSIRRYFEKIGVDQFYTPGSTDPEMFKRMQYATTNYLGFVGYQFSEQDLWVLGYYVNYYLYKEIWRLRRYYVDVDVTYWSDDVRALPMYFEDSGWVYVTDVNTWTGTFTGKHGIYTMEDYKDPDKQEFIALDHFEYKYNNIVKQLATAGKTVDDFVGSTLYWNGVIPPISPPPGGRSNKVTVTVSGLLAGAHLRGAAGVYALLIEHQNHADENGTTILQYV